MGVSDDGKVVVIKLDDGEPEDEYAVLHAVVRRRRTGHVDGIRWRRRLLHV